MYKIYVKLKGKNGFVPYTIVENERVVEYETNDTIELKDKYIELLNKYSKDELRVVKDISTELSMSISEINSFKTLVKLENYLYEMTYDNLDYEYAKEYFKTKGYLPTNFSCSSVRKGNLYGRNYDWYYNHQPTFIVHTKANDNRHASMSVCAGHYELTEEFVDSGKYSSLYKMLPFVVLDGINDAGLICNVNVVPANDFGKTIGTIPEIEKLNELSVFMVLRYVLDNFGNATTAVNYLRDYCSIYSYDNFEFHYMIADSNKTYIVEFINNEIEIIDVTNDRPYMTNFYIKDSIFNSSTNKVDRTSLTPYGSGVERYELIAENYNDISDINDMIDLMHNKLKYTKSYDSETNPYWYTEFVGKYGGDIGDLTVLSPDEDFETVVQRAQELYKNRTRDINNTWQTVHSVTYDMVNKVMYIIPQETGSMHIIGM